MIKATGTYPQVIEKISGETQLPNELTAAVLSFVIKNPEILTEEEIIEIKCQNEDSVHGKSDLLLGNGKYYVLLKEITLFAASFLLTEQIKDLTGIDLKTISAAVAIFKDFRGGTIAPPFGKLEEESGVKCILKETMKNRKGNVTADTIKKMIGAHCENEYKCKYKKGGCCQCREEDIKDILAHLAKNRIISGDNVEGYNVNW